MKRIMIIIILMLIIVIGTISNLNRDEDKVQLELVSELDKIVQISELNTYNAVYNGVAKSTHRNADGSVDYYISYEAVIKLGINFEEISFSAYDELKTIFVLIPEIEMLEVNVDIGSLDYIFINKGIDESTILDEAYQLCIADARDESMSESEIFTLARQNTENIVKALVNPFIENSYPDYVLDFNK